MLTLTILSACFCGLILIIGYANEFDFLLEDFGFLVPSWMREEVIYCPLRPSKVEAISSPAQKEEALGLDSFDCLTADLETEGLEIAFLTCKPFSGGLVAVVASEGLETPCDVCVDEFSDACNPESAPVYLSMDISDAVVLAANIRDGLGEDTLIEYVDNNPTAILVEDLSEAFIPSMVESILFSAKEENLDPSILRGDTLSIWEDEVTISSCWEEDFSYAPTIVDLDIQASFEASM